METVFSGLEDQSDHLRFKAKTTIRQLVHVNSRRWAAKALSVGETLGIRVIYPVIWKEVLIGQGELPWGAKVHRGIVKWQLKRLLEEFMPESFIYRKKNGFVPPLVIWLTDKQFNHKIRDILIKRNGYVNQMVPIKILDELLLDALGGRMLRSPILNFLWGAIFTEAWIQRYRKGL
jgi:asparagine synthase (glutamine-hydrolysing)